MADDLWGAKTDWALDMSISPQREGVCKVSCGERWEPRADITAHELRHFKSPKDDAKRRIKRVLRAWPECNYGGTIELGWSDDGKAYWYCTRCNT